jgi:putative nucleotidyltransferase with HDIG domain
MDMMNQAMVGLWEHSVGCALASSTIARFVGLKDVEDVSVAGLLHDLGKVVTAVQLPEMKVGIDAEVKTHDLTYLDAEKTFMGFGHDRVNAWIADHWKLPPSIKEGMSYHHKPQLARVYPEVACCVHLGDFMVRVFEYGSGGDDNVLYLEPDALKKLKLKSSDIEAILDQLCEQFLDIADLSFV